jgi:hypothetical protein
MGLFSKTPPQPATTDLTLAQFAAKRRRCRLIRDVANRFGPQLSELMLQALYDRTCHDDAGPGVGQRRAELRAHRRAGLAGEAKPATCPAST